MLGNKTSKVSDIPDEEPDGGRYFKIVKKLEIPDSLPLS